MLTVVDQCGRRRVAALVVITAGLHASGPVGHAAERTLVDRARGSGMRLIGPESLGCISTHPGV